MVEQGNQQNIPTGRFFIEGIPYSERDLAEACIDGPAWGHVPAEHSGTADLDSIDIHEVMSHLTLMQAGGRALLSATGTRSNTKFKFNYVGVIALFRHVFIILPKYYDPQGYQTMPMPWLVATLNTIFAAVHQYHRLRAEAKQLDEIVFDPSSPVATAQNQLGLYEFLLRDYAEHGAYREPRRIHEWNGEGLIDWSRTIDQVNPVLTADGRPAYMELVTTRRRRDEANFIARVQEAIVAEICSFLTFSGLGALFRWPSSFAPNPSVETVDNLGGADYLASRLDRELAVRFDTHSKRLINALIDYLRGRAQTTVQNTVIAEGTASFNLVWESICQQLFHDRRGKLDMPKPHWNHRLDKDMHWQMHDSVGKTVEDGYAKTEIGEANQEESASGSDEYDGGKANPHTLIPDVINKDDPHGWYILDAKYYVPTYKQNSITGAPGIGDIIKQYFYMMALSKRAEITVRGNAFLIPGRIPAGENAPVSRPESRYLLLQRGVVSLDFIGAFLGDGKATQNSVVRMFELDPEQAIAIYTALSAGDAEARSRYYLNAMFHSSPAAQTEQGNVVAFVPGIPAQPPVQEQ